MSRRARLFTLLKSDSRSFFATARRFKRWIYASSLIFLVCLLAIALKQLPTPPPSQLPTIQQVELSQVNEPIQPIPLAVALDRKKVALGKQLFEDVRLSKNERLSCLSCHSFSTGGADRKLHGVGEKQSGSTNTLTVFNSGFNHWLNWNGRFESLVSHVDGPFHNSQMMGSNWGDVVTKLRSAPEYRQAFAANYADGLTPNNIKDAIATYEQSLYTPNSRFDQFLRGKTTALTVAEQKGYQIFKAYGCVSCHQGVNIGGNVFQRFGVIGDYFADRGNITDADMGRFNVTGKEADRYVFRVPSLRNVALTFPYFHDGSAQTLEQATSIMAKYQLGRPLAKEQITAVID